MTTYSMIFTTTIGEFEPKWKCRKRGGLEALDLVFFFYTLIALIAVAASHVAIGSKIRSLAQPDPGAFILVIYSVLFAVFSFAFVYFPYFTAFPSRIDEIADCKKHANPVTPSPWPFCSDDLGKLCLIALGGLVTSLANRFSVWVVK